MSQVVYDCATGAQLGTGLNTFCYFHSPSSSDRILTLGLSIESIRLYHPLDGVTNPKYKLLYFLTALILQREEGTSFLPG